MKNTNTLKEFKRYFQEHYGFIHPQITDAEWKAFLSQPYIAECQLSKQADLFADYCLANGLAEVQE